MAKHTVNIELHAGGGSQVAAEMGKAGKASADFIVNIKKIGNLFGELGSNIGGLVQNLLRGGVWGIAEAAARGILSLGKMAWDALKASKEKADKAVVESIGKHQKYIDDYVASVKKASDTEMKLISDGLSMTKRRIDATRELTAATLEFEKALERSASAQDRAAAKDAQGLAQSEKMKAQAEKKLAQDEKVRAVAQGDESGVKKAETKISAADRKIADANKRILEADKRLMALDKVLSGYDRKIDEARLDAEREKLQADIDAAKKMKSQAEKDKARYERAARVQDKIVKDANKAIKENRAEARGKASWWTWKNEREYKEQYEASDTHKKLVESRKKAKDDRDELKTRIADAKQRAEKAQADIAAAQQALKALEKTSAAMRENAKQDEKDKDEELRRRRSEAESAEKIRSEAESKQLERRIADTRKQHEKEIAAEREKQEQKLHQKRMENLREEIAAQKDAASVLTSRASAAQSEFDRAFAMYRDPSRAAAEIGEEKDYQNDLDRLHRDARGYGGKWRIDELSRLMSAGDTQGVTDTLKEWRRSKGFTPEIEAMVRASAAEKTKTTAEDELRKVNDKVASMSDVLKQMADSQSGKLGTIADSTSGLAAKVDQLLQVKG